VGVDEAGDHDAIGGIDHRSVGGGDAGAHLANLAILDEHVGLREVADLPVEREHHAAQDQDAALSQHARKLGIVALCLRAGGEHGGYCRGADETRARPQEVAA